MKRINKVLISYLLLLVFAFSSIFANTGITKAATLENFSEADGILISTESGHTKYTLTTDLTKESATITITLSGNETVILDGNGHTITANSITIMGTGTFIFRNINIVTTNTYDGGVITSYDDTPGHIHLVFQGKEPITVKQKTANSNTSAIANGLLLATYTNVDVEEGANVTLYGGDRNETDNSFITNIGSPIEANNTYTSFFNVSPKANLTLVNGKYTMNGVLQPDIQGYQINGKYLVVPTRLFTQNPVKPYSESQTPSSFNIATIVNGSTTHTESYAAFSQTSIDKQYLPIYFGYKYDFVGYY